MNGKQKRILCCALTAVLLMSTLSGCAIRITNPGEIRSTASEASDTSVGSSGNQEPAEKPEETQEPIRPVPVTEEPEPEESETSPEPTDPYGTPAPSEEPAETAIPAEGPIVWNDSWEFADFSAIHSGSAYLYRAHENRKNIVVGVNAGHGTEGGGSVYTYCHPDMTPKVTGGTTAAGSVQAMAVSSGMTFYDGTPERDVTLQMARILKDLLLEAGYDVLMLRDGDDVQLDNVARTVICNNNANCHIALHWDGDGLDYDKGCFYMAVPDALQGMYPVSGVWEEDNRLGESLILGLTNRGCPIMSSGSMKMDLTQTSFSSIPSVDIELGNAASDHSDDALYARGYGLLEGINIFFGF